MVWGFTIGNTDVLRGLLLAGCLLAGTFNAGLIQASGIGMKESILSETASSTDTAKGIVMSGLDAASNELQHPAILQITGNISQADDDQITIDMTTLENLTRTSISTSTVVTDGIRKFEGVLMRAVLDYVGAYGTSVTATALNGYQVEIPVRDFNDFDVLLAWAMDGKRLEGDDKGPFWIVYPRDQHEVLQDIRYDYRWVWQLSSLRVH